MKILLTTLNSKFVHSNLALRYLREVCAGEETVLREYSINDRVDLIAGDIFKIKADIIGLSCYIWNIAPTLELVSVLRQVSPRSTIVLGGPEVSYDPGKYLEHAGVDFVVYGEGEVSFASLVQYLKQPDGGLPLSDIKGIAYQGNKGPVVNPPQELIADLALIPSPYNRIDGLENKIAYVESSRGCPFNCQYCLSSTIQGVRFFPLERTKAELKRLVESGVKQVKFVDRTFNCQKKHALEVMSFLAEWNPEANFHFEIEGELLDEEILDFLKGVPAGLFQFEVGVQSTNPKTLQLIDRRTDLARLESNVRAVKAGGNIAQYLDLIAGLPGEDYQSFAQSFNEVYSWQPEKIQLGFLKLLKGSGIRKRSEAWGYKFMPNPPYTVLSNNWLSYEELLKLQVIEDLVDKYYNSGRFKQALGFMVGQYAGNPFAFFEDLAGYWEEQGYHRVAHKARVLYDHLLDFYLTRHTGEKIFTQLLKFDYLLWEKPTRFPAWLEDEKVPFFKQKVDSFFRQTLRKLMPQLSETPARELHKYFEVAAFQPAAAPYLGIPQLAEGEPLFLLFYYPGPLIRSAQPGFIPIVL